MTLIQHLNDTFSEFQSDARIASLYSDLQATQSTNPIAYTHNISFWTKAIKSASEAGLIPLVFSTDWLRDALRHAKFGTPAGISLILVFIIHLILGRSRKKRHFTAIYG